MENANTKQPKKIARIIALSLIVIASCYYGITKYIYSAAHEVTDNAQLDGNIVPIIPRVSGFVDTMNIEDNQIVNKGELLIKLDDKDFTLKVKQAEAALLNAQSDYEVKAALLNPLRLNIVTIRSQIEEADIKLKKSLQDYKRLKNLLEVNAATQQQFDDANAEYDNRLISLKIIRDQLGTSTAQLNAEATKLKTAETIIQQKKVEFETAQLNLSYTRILSPVSGTISRKNIQPGQYIQQGSAFCAITSSEQPWVIANFKETQASKIRKGMKVSIKIDAFPGQTFDGIVETISSATGARFSLLPPDNATGNFVKVVQRISTKIRLNKYDNAKFNLCNGMSCEASVLTK